MIYYAHSKLDYNTKQEQDDLILLHSLYGEVVDPKEIEPSLYGAAGYNHMKPYLDAVKSCKMLVLRCHIFPYVGKGAFCEMCWALAFGKPCVVFNEVNILVPLNGIVLHDAKDWKVKYGRIM